MPVTIEPKSVAEHNRRLRIKSAELVRAASELLTQIATSRNKRHAMKQEHSIDPQVENERSTSHEVERETTP